MSRPVVELQPDLPAAYADAARLDGGGMDCGGGLLLLLTRALRQVEVGDALVLRTEEPSVLADLPAWSRLAGHPLVAVAATSPAGPWQIAIRRDGSARQSPPARTTSTDAGYSTGSAAPLGSRLWVYTNFDCNLACDYCCAASGPRVERRRFPVELATEALAQFAALGGREVLLTGGEPFLHPQLNRLVELVPASMSVTILTNAMIFSRGPRRALLDALDPARVTLQVSLDSATAPLHDAHRGPRAHARSLEGISLATSLGFVVRIAATVADASPRATAPLHDLLDDLGIPANRRVVRPIAAQGAADNGLALTVDTVEPEPTLTVDGAWWHPVAVTDPAMRLTDHPLPLAEVFATVADLVAVQDRARADGMRHVFRCV